MSLNRYHNSRSSDKTFKLLHEEASYLDILKGNVKAMHKDEIEEDKAVAPHDTARQTLLQEQETLSEEDPGMEKVEDSKVDEEPKEDEGTPEQQEKAAAEDAPQESDETDKEMGMKEEIEQEIDEISIAVARQASGAAAKRAAMARKGLLRGKGSLKKYGAPDKKKAFVPGLR